MSKREKENKDHQIGVRLTDSQYADLLLKITDADGNQIISPAAFCRSAITSAKVTIVDSELEKYRTFVAARIGNLRNQLVRVLHKDRKSGIVSEKTYLDILEKIQDQDDELNKLLEPLR